MMKQTAKNIRSFFYSQQFADGIRITLVVLLPAVITSYFNAFPIGITIALGALSVSLVDSPGPIIHRKNAMLSCIGFIFIVAFLTALAQKNVYIMGLEVVGLSFFFSMFNVYGMRAAFVGSAALLVMVLTMDSPIPRN